MIHHIVIYYTCDRCGRDEDVIADFTCASTDGHPEICMYSVRNRLERSGWTFDERQGKFEPWQGKYKGLCNECTNKACKLDIDRENWLKNREEG